MNAGSGPGTPAGRTTTSFTVWPSLLMICPVPSSSQPLWPPRSASSPARASCHAMVSRLRGRETPLAGRQPLPGRLASDRLQLHPVGLRRVPRRPPGRRRESRGPGRRADGQPGSMDSPEVLEICSSVPPSLGEPARRPWRRFCLVVAGSAKAASGSCETALEHLLAARSEMDRRPVIG